MGISFWHLIILFAIILVVFGAGKIPQVMGDVAKGIKAFKDGLNDSNPNHSTVSPSKKIDDVQK